MNVQPRMAAEGRAWYVRVVVVRRRPGDLVVVPLGDVRPPPSGPTTFATLEEATAAGRAAARAWIDREEGEAP